MIRRHSDIPLRRDGASRFLPWSIAFMVYLAVLSLAAAMLFDTAVSRWSAGFSGTLTVQIPLAAKTTNGGSDGRLKRAVGVLEATPGVARIRVLARGEIVALIAPWLGADTVSDDLPLPRLIDVTMRQTGGVDLAALRRRLGKVAPGATVDDHREWLAGLIAFVRSVEIVAAGIVALTAVITVLTVIFAARAGLAVHAPIVELLHLIGARDGYIARQFQRHALSLGLWGGLLGLALAGVTLAGLAAIARAVKTGLLPALTLSLAQWLTLAALPFAAAAIAMVTARLTVLRSLARMP